jgi:hypothetical protein
MLIILICESHFKVWVLTMLIWIIVMKVLLNFA